MFYSKLALGIVALGLSVTPGLAQQFYGSVGLSYQSNDGTNGINDPAVDDPDNEPLNFGQAQADLSFGARFNNGYYAQMDLSHIDTDVPANTGDTLHQGTTFALRGGRDFGQFQLGAFLGYIDATIDDTAGNNKVYRTFGGLEGRYDISSKFWATGELAAIGGPSGNQGSPDGTDGLYDGAYIVAGLGYEISPRFSVEGSVGYADAKSDDDPTYVKTAGIGVNYTFNNPAIMAYARYDYTDYYQTGEDDGMYNQTLKVGVSYQFGAKPSASRRLRPQAPIVDWLGYTGGHLE